jgi:hypothetical protein
MDALSLCNLVYNRLILLLYESVPDLKRINQAPSQTLIADGAAAIFSFMNKSRKKLNALAVLKDRVIGAPSYNI